MKEKLKKTKEAAKEIGEQIFHFIFGTPEGNCKCEITSGTSGGWAGSHRYSYYSYVCPRCYRRGRRERDAK